MTFDNPYKQALYDLMRANEAECERLALAEVERLKTDAGMDEDDAVQCVGIWTLQVAQQVEREA